MHRSCRSTRHGSAGTPRLEGSGHWPATLPPGFALDFQDWLLDVDGWSASNGLRALTP